MIDVKDLAMPYVTRIAATSHHQLPSVVAFPNAFPYTRFKQCCKWFKSTCTLCCVFLVYGVWQYCQVLMPGLSGQSGQQGWGGVY